ncbi:MAG: AEC family transporter [Clostridia bacterium]|nr:AEC family transporter [Clostridia bacterium]
MPAFGALLKYIFLFTVLMIPGYIMGRRKRLMDEAMTSLANILTDIAMPFLVFSKLLAIDVKSLRISYILCCILLPIVIELSMLGIACLVFRKKEDRSRYPIDRFCTFLPNVGFIGIPLACSIFPDVPEIALYVSLANIVSTYILLTMGIFTLTEDKRDISVKKMFTSPVLFAIILGFLGSMLPENPVTAFAADYSVYLANLATPLSMLVLGYNLAKLSVMKLLKDTGVYMVSLLRLIISPILTIFVLVITQKVLRVPVDYELVMAMFIAMGVSNAGTAPAMAKRYGLNGEHAAAVTIGTTILSVATIPVVYLLAECIF